MAAGAARTGTASLCPRMAPCRIRPGRTRTRSFGLPPRMDRAALRPGHSLLRRVALADAAGYQPAFFPCHP